MSDIHNGDRTAGRVREREAVRESLTGKNGDIILRKQEPFLKESSPEKIITPMFLAVLFTIIKRSKQAKYP